MKQSYSLDNTINPNALREEFETGDYIYLLISENNTNGIYIRHRLYKNLSEAETEDKG